MKKVEDFSKSFKRLGRDVRVRNPRYQKLRARGIHIWNTRRGQPNRSAMEGPHPGGTSFMIKVASTPGKYAEGSVTMVHIEK